MMSWSLAFGRSIRPTRSQVIGPLLLLAAASPVTATDVWNTYSNPRFGVVVACRLPRQLSNTLVGTLRAIYGPSFASGFAGDVELSAVLQALDEPSLTELVHDHQTDHLGAEITKHT